MPPIQRTKIRALRMSALLLTGCAGQKVDPAYTPHIATPDYSAGGPSVCIDEAHNNSHTAGGLYEPFARLLEADGFSVVRLKTDFHAGIARECKVMVIVNAAGGKTYKVFGLNLPTRSRERRQESAFTPMEIDRIKSWVESGGSLLLVADHYPYGEAAAPLATSLGIDMSGGFTEAANVDSAHTRDRTRLVYSRANGLLGDHPITNGRSAAERVNRVVTFTGQSLASASGIPLLILGGSAVDYVPVSGSLRGQPARGRSQAIALNTGAGRVIVMGEAAALTAQVDNKGRKFGMQLAGEDNELFALNIVRWLARLF
jgi:hypothetical protein